MENKIEVKKKKSQRSLANMGNYQTILLSVKKIAA